MFIKQLSVFVENREGRLDEVLQLLKEKDINILSMSLADTEDYGLLRMIVSKPEEGRDVLKNAGITAVMTDVIGVRIPNRSGELQKLLAYTSKAHINIEYMYGFCIEKDDACVVIKATNSDDAKKVIEVCNEYLLTENDINEMF